MVSIKSLLVCSLISTGVIAKVNCKPLVEEKKMAKLELEDFSKGLERIYKKIQTLEGKLQQKEDTISQILTDIDVQQSIMVSIQSEISTIKSGKNSAQSELVQVDSEVIQITQRISQIEYQLSHSTGSQSRRELLREKMRKQMTLQRLVSQKQSLLQVIASVDDQIRPLRQERNAAKLIKANLQAELISFERQMPSIALLQEKITKEEMVLADTQAIESELLMSFDETKEKVLMCHTYNLKYPLVLAIAAEISEVGCGAYQLQGFQSQTKIDAEADILSSLCAQN